MGCVPHLAKIAVILTAHGRESDIAATRLSLQFLPTQSP
jgi:hypothetical protein